LDLGMILGTLFIILMLVLALWGLVRLMERMSIFTLIRMRMVQRLQTLRICLMILLLMCRSMTVRLELMLIGISGFQQGFSLIGIL
jgi:hypothetical protein